jgi:pimeloyl-ACP methyl ester carboxylesterase
VELLQSTIVDRLRDAELQVVAGASHCIQLDQPRITAGIIQDWMTHHDA